MVSRMKSLSIILSYFLGANLVQSFSPLFAELVNPATAGQGKQKASDIEIIPHSNGRGDYLVESILSSKGPPTILDTQLPQSRPDVLPIHVRTDQSSTSNDQSNLLKPSDSMNVALEPGDIPSIPGIPFLGGGSGEMNYGGPNLLEQIQQMWQHPFDVHHQVEPDCEPRAIPWGGAKQLFKMFAMCCGPRPQNSGPGSQNRLRVEWRRSNCYLWTPEERCTPDTIHCCLCKNERKVGYECIKYYTDQGLPADTVPDPAHPKRDAIPMTRRQDDIAANEPFSAVDPNELSIEETGLLPLPPATAEKDILGNIAMELGGTSENTPRKRPKGGGRQGPAEWSCLPEFERSQGGSPRVPKPRKYPPPGTVDNVQSPPPAPWNPDTENDADDYSDLEVPDGWSDNYYWSP